MMSMACRMVRHDWQKHPWLRLIACGAGGGLAAAVLFVVAAGLLLAPGPADQGALALAMAASLGLAAAGCWRGGARAWTDVGRPEIPAETRQWVYLALAAPAVIALPGALLGAGYLADWLGAALAAGAGYAWWRYGRRAASAPVAVDQSPPQSPGPERLH